MSQFTIQLLVNGEWQDKVTLDPTTNTRRNGEPNPKDDTAVGALRAYGLWHVRKDGTATSSKLGKEYRAVPVETKVKNSKKNSKPAKNAPVAQTENVQTDEAAPYGYNSKGEPNTPYGVKLDGTPAKRRGRKPAQVEQIAPTKKVKKNKGKNKKNFTPQEKMAADILKQVEKLQSQYAELIGA